MLIRVGPKCPSKKRKGYTHTEGHKEEARVTREAANGVRWLQGKERDCSSHQQLGAGHELMLPPSLMKEPAPLFQTLDL